MQVTHSETFVSQVVELPQSDASTSDPAEAGDTMTMRGAAFHPEYVQWSLRHRNLRRTSGVPLNNIFWCVVWTLTPTLTVSGDASRASRMLGINFNCEPCWPLRAGATKAGRRTQPQTPRRRGRRRPADHWHRHQSPSTRRSTARARTGRTPPAI